MIRAGLVGKKVPSYDSRWDEKGHTMISHIFVSFSEFITCVQFGYLKDGALVLSETFGFSEGSFRTVKLNQDEYITGLSGVVEKMGGIINLTFHTNRGKHGPIGRSSDGCGRSCSTIEIDPAISDRSEFSGFFGTYNSHYLSAIGIYVSPTPMTGTMGKNMISNIYVTFDDYGIQSLQFIYFHEGAHVESQKHGYSGGQHIKRVTTYIQVRLEHDEYVTALSGVHYQHRITSLTFHTNKRKHGPFCKKFEHLKDCKREIDVGVRDRSEFGGLFGSFAEKKYCYLRSIGMYVSHNRSSIDAVPRTRFGATYDHQLIPLEPLDHTTTRLHYQTPKIVDGFPVKPSRRCKSKLKDRILSKINKAIQFLINL
ncbi:unnamed protein product [Brassica rapa subsp. trilocularis]